MADYLELVADVGMVVGPCAGYLIQCQKIIASGSSEGFSPYVSFILILSNLIRLFWYQAEPFSQIILYAAVLMIACQLVLLFVWVSANKSSQK